MHRFLVPFIAVVLLSGCAEKWTKAGATSQDFDAMQSACFSRAARRFPVWTHTVMARPGYTTPITTQCNRTPGGMNCVQQGGDMVPPSFYEVDDGKDARDADMRSCFYEHGWHPAED